MEIQQFIVDAFADQQFSGNTAAVCLLEEEISKQWLQKIAFENALPETAFITLNDYGYDISWFTPRIEMDLCGHATLATAHVLWQHLDHNEQTIALQSNSGPLEVMRKGDKYILDFPTRMPEPSALPNTIKKGLNIQPQQVLKSRDYVLIYEDEQQIKDLVPDEKVWADMNIDPGGVAVTAPGTEVDFVSRYFTPQGHCFEDPVTGSVHCSLIPYWSKRLDKKNFKAWQLSERHGTLFCEHHNERVHIGGRAKTFSEGTVFLDI